MTDEDNIAELRFDLIHNEDWMELIKTPQYKTLLKETDNETLKTAYELLNRSNSVNTWADGNGKENNVKRATFADNLEIVTDPGGLPITLRTATMKSKTKMIAEQREDGYYVKVYNHYKLYDRFEEPYNVVVKNGKIVGITFLTKKETGNPYSMSSGYRDRSIIEKTFKNKEEALKFIKSQIK